MRDSACLAAAILAGGRAERFGRADKSSLLIQGEPILQRVLRAIRPQADRIFAVGDRFGAAAAAGLDVYEDLEPDMGPLGGIYTALVRSPCDRTLVVACDMPYLTERFIAHLAGIEPADVVIPRDATGYQPLCAVYSRACVEPLRQRLARGERHAAAPLEGVRVVEIGRDQLAAFDPGGWLFVNVNTPHDYERARRMEADGRAPV